MGRKEEHLLQGRALWFCCCSRDVFEDPDEKIETLVWNRDKVEMSPISHARQCCGAERGRLHPPFSLFPRRAGEDKRCFVGECWELWCSGLSHRDSHSEASWTLHPFLR